MALTIDDLTKGEMKAIKALQRLEKNWPKRLMLFAGYGSCICVLDSESLVASIPPDYVEIPLGSMDNNTVAPWGG